MSRYPDEEAINILLDQHLTMVAPATERFHFHHEPMHDHAHLNVCAFQGSQRLMFTARAYKDHVFTERFQYLGTGECHANTGIDARVELLMNRYPDAHIQFVDDEEDDDPLFGYVAYDDDDWKVIDWAPLEEGVKAVPRLETIPDGLQDLLYNLRAGYTFD